MMLLQKIQINHKKYGSDFIPVLTP